MKFSLVALALWAAGSALNALLLFVLFFKRRVRLVPWFTAWMTYDLLYAAACFLVYRMGLKDLYRWVYWIGALGDFLLQIAVVAELASGVLKREGRWIDGARRAVLPFVILGPLIAGLLAGFMTPAVTNTLNGLAARASLFSTVLICFLFMAVVRASMNLGLDWRSHLARESFGLTVWALAAFVTDTLHAYWRTMGHFQELENVRIAFFQGALLFWCVAFWLPEPETSHPNAAQLNDCRDIVKR